MGQLTNLYVSQSYQGLIKLANSTTGVTGTLQYTQDGLGNNLPIQISTSSVNITGSFTVNNLPIVATDTGSLVTTASFNAYTSSNDSKVNSLISATGSYATTSSLTSLSSSIASTDLSQNNRLSSIETVTGSLQLQINQKLDTGSFNSYTSSNDSKVNSLIASTGSYATTSSLTSLSQSIALTDLNQDNVIAGLATTSSLTNLSSSIATTDLGQNNRLGSLETATGSLQNQINQKLDTGSFNSYTASMDARTGSYATTGSNVFQGLQTISGSLIVTGSITALSASITYLQTVYQTSSVVFSSGSNILGDEASDTQTLNGQVNIPLGNLNITGSTTSSLGFFGNLQGTSSYATNALSSSHSVNSDTSISSSYSLNSTSASFAQNSISSSQSQNAVSSSYSLNSTSASFSQNTISGSFSNFAVSSSHSVNSDTSISSSYAQTASFASNGGVTQLLAGPNIIISPLSGKGQVTISSTGTGTGSFNTATGSYGSFYDTTNQINPVANTPNSMSFNETAITNGVAISGSISPFNTYIKTENAGIYNLQFSAQLDKTDSGTDSVDIWIRKNGSDLLDTATTVTLTGNNDKSVAAWNWFVQSAANDYYQIIWASADTNMRLLAEVSSSVHPGVPSVIATANRIDQFLSNTGSFNGDFNGSFTGSLEGTASFATNALSASQSDNANLLDGKDSTEFATTGSNIFKGNQTISGSLLTNTLNNGLITIITEAQNSSSLAIPFGYITASNAVSQSNLIFGAQTGPTGVGQLTNNLTGSIVISGSNNIILGGNRVSTLVTQGTYGYIGGSNNIGTAIPTLGTGSILRPTISNNALQSALSLQFTTSSLAAPGLNSNLIYGATNINHQSSSIQFLNNIVGINVTSNANTTTLDTLPNIQANAIIGSTLALNHNSSSITYLQNVGALNVTNNYSSSVSAVVNNITVSQNFAGGSNQQLIVSGSNSGTRRTFNSNFLMGRNNIANSFHSGSPFTGGHLVSTALIGQELIVSASHTSTTVGGTVIVGRYNATGSLQESSQDTVFVVGTGVSAGTRRNALRIDSNGDSSFTGSVNISGSLNSNGNTTITGSVISSEGFTGSLQGNASTATSASLAIFANTASYVLQAVSASYATDALTASFALNAVSTDTGSLMKTGSVAGNILTFTKGDGTTFDLTVATGSGGGSAFPFTGSAIISGSLQVIGGTTMTGSVTLSGSVGPELIVIGDSIFTGSLTLSGSANPELTVIGNTILTGSVQGNVNALSISSNTASLDLNNGNFFTLQLVSGSATHINPSNIKPGQTINILLSTTGSGTVNFPSSVKQVSGSSYVPTTTTSKDIITLVSFDSTNLYLANVKNLV